MIKRFSLFAVALASAAILSGCSSTRIDSHGFSASTVDPYVEINKTTIEDVRALLGTPTVTATTKADGAKVVRFWYCRTQRDGHLGT